MSGINFDAAGQIFAGLILVMTALAIVAAVLLGADRKHRWVRNLGVALLWLVTTVFLAGLIVCGIWLTLDGIGRY